MKVQRPLLIVLAVSLCFVAGVRRPFDEKAQARTGPRPSSSRVGGARAAPQQAEELLALSERQNFENHALALETARRALALFQAAADSPGIARSYSQIAGCYNARNDLPEAAQNYERALQLWRELNNPREQAVILISLGYIENRKGEWQNSIAFFTRAEELTAGTDDPFLAGQIALGLAYIFNENGLPEIGLAQNQRALAHYRQTPDARDDMLTILEIGITYYLLENYPEALSHLRQALDSVAPGSIDAALCHHFLGKVYSSAGDHAAAFRHLETALPIYLRAGNPKEAAEVLGLMGQNYQQQGRLEPARQYYRRALATFIKLSDRINQAALYYALGQAELKAGNYDAAEDYLRQSLEATENVRRVSTSSDLTAAFSATVQERYEKYIECLMRKREAGSAQGLDVRAFQTSELARARSLAELLRATETNLVPGLDPQLAEREKSLRQSLRVKEDYKVALLSRANRPEELASLDAELERLEAEYELVAETIRARYPSYRQLTQPAAWGLRQIQEEVIADDQTVLLEYSLGEDRSYVWAVTRDRITSHELPARARINQAAQKVYALLAAPPRPGAADELTTAIRELGGLILAPVAGDLNKRRLVVVADGSLNYIPFQVLPSPSAPDEPLVAGREVINAPSASVLGELRREAARRRPAAKMLAAFGDPVFATNYALRKEAGGGEQLAAARTPETGHLWHALRDLGLNADSFDPSALQPLHYARRELANLRDAASAGETFVATDFAATRDALISADLTQYAILHFATHGFLDPKRPEHSGLVLSTVNREGREQNGFVSLQDIYQLRTPVSLVVLSACSTALGKEVRGEGLIGLTRGFMYAGASSVLASLWKVDDEATAELMKRFYGNLLQDGMTPAEALRAAQNSFRQEGWPPYYWAAFTLQGEYRQQIKPATTVPPPPSTKLIAGGAALALLSGAAWLYRRRRRRLARANG
jgi:CHAT domain-containing protein